MMPIDSDQQSDQVSVHIPGRHGQWLHTEVLHQLKRTLFMTSLIEQFA